MTGAHGRGGRFYVGLGTRFDAGPSEAMTNLGFRAETSQAGFLHHGLGLADLAHVLALTEVGALPPQTAARLARALLDMHETQVADFGYDARDGDAYNSRERVLRERLGTDAGWLSYGRTRREAGRQAFGLACRASLLARHAELETLVGVLVEKAEYHRATWWSDQTYWLPAQVSTLGHYLLSFGFEAARTLPRIRASWERCGLVPLAAGGVAGTRVPVQPLNYQRRLWADTVTTTTRDAMWAVDGLLDLAVIGQHLTLTATRLAEDFMVFATEPFSWVRLDDAHCRASVYLPQKRNPYALTAIRGTHAVVSGRLAGLITSLHTGSAQTDNWIFNYGEVAEVLDLSGLVVSLASEVLARASFDTQRLAQAARDGFADAADLAEQLVLDKGMDYRSAHEAVAERITAAEREGDHHLPSQDSLEDLVEARRGAGGAAAVDLDEALGLLRDDLADRSRWRTVHATRTSEAEEHLLPEARHLAAATSHHTTDANAPAGPTHITEE